MHSPELSPDLLSLLVCPRCKGKLEPMDDGASLVCRGCRLKYPVVDGIPVMLIDEAEELGDE